MRSGWETKSLGDVCALISRGVAPKYVEAGGVAVLNQKCVRDHCIAFDLGRRHDAAAKKVDPERFIRVGDVLVNSTGTGTLGRVAQVRSEPLEPTTVDTHVTIVRPEAGRFYPDFFGYMLIQIEDEIARSGEGASGQTELARSTLQNRFFVSFPTSLPEQQRIVAILDEAFAGLATATANTEKNVKNARELFESYLSSIFDEGHEDWQQTTLGAEIELLVGFAFKSAQYTKSESGIRLLRGDNIIQNALRWDDVKRWPSSDVEKYENYKLEAGDIVLAMDRTWVKAGLKFAVLGESDVPSLLVQRVARLRCREQLDNRFLAHLIGSPKFTRYVLDIQTGLGVPHISGKQISDFSFRRPAISEQRKIGVAIHELAAEVAALEDAYKEKLTGFADLKQSILQKAFSGELTSPPSQAIKEAAE